jgi:hypothetical protein
VVADEILSAALEALRAQRQGAPGHSDEGQSDEGQSGTGQSDKRRGDKRRSEKVS